MNASKSKLKRDRQPMPDFVKEALVSEGLMRDYESRPPYQRNDYLLWINEAKQDATKKRRLRQMLDELSAGGVYMKMKHRGSRKD